MEKALFKTVPTPVKKRNAIIDAICQIFRILRGKPAVEPETKKLGLTEAEAVLDSTIVAMGLDPEKDDICEGNKAIPIVMTQSALLFGAEVTVLDEVQEMITEMNADNTELDETTKAKLDKLQKKIEAIQRAMELRKTRTAEQITANNDKIKKAEMVGKFFDLAG